MMRTILILTLVLGALTARARLGESEEQLTNRYGAVIQVRTNDGLRSLTFDFHEYLVLARLRDGKSVVEFAYLKKKGVDFVESDALAIASRMAGATNWSVMSSAAFQKSWAIKTGGGSGFVAQLNTPPSGPQSIMVFTSAEMLRREKQHPTNGAASGF